MRGRRQSKGWARRGARCSRKRLHWRVLQGNLMVEKHHWRVLQENLVPGGGEAPLEGVQATFFLLG